MSSRLTSLYCACLLALLTGCTTFGGLAKNESADWAFQGKMAIKNATEASSFNITWQQLGETFDIELSGPLGQGRMSIHGDENAVTLIEGNDQWSANSLEDLLWDLQQIQLPLDYLQYWVRARPKPAERYSQKLDADTQKVKELNQAGWRVQYDSYHETVPSMPRKLSFIRKNNSGKLVIREWSLLQLSPS